ncbi:hypothetical protein PpBr36_04108 [Pyricularia pennisetigena]|uniref:hypothetical protein n=1 Tax=Pyricularia pennisetigena TaxID=1578925 RepID=UPI001154EC93|nr:hypothetical protein PpBr36_04108 [Pyricularia pennisetigena]TLS27436.1 hypothetical protein PpBr36_04108 [Pyricularia pennisetigena]
MVFGRNVAFFAAVAIVTTSASALELIGSEVPSACQQICMPVVLLSGACATAERKVLGTPPPPGTAIPSSSTQSPPAATPPSSSLPPPPSSSSNPLSSSTPPLPPAPPESIPSVPPPPTPTPATTQPPATPPAAAPALPTSGPPVQLTPSPGTPPAEATSPPPQPTPTEPATTSAARRSREDKDDRSSSSSRELNFGPAANSFLAALSSAKADRQRKGKQRDVDAADNDPALPTAVPGLESAQKRALGGRDSAVGRRQENVEHDQFQRACYCRNLSFDVSGISGLCGSCMAQSSNTEQERKGLADANSILAKCGFPTATYQPDAAKQAAGITLVAVMPSRMPSNDPGGLVFVPGTLPTGDGPVPATSGSGDGQGPVQRGGVGEMATSGSLAVLIAVCWALLALVAI